MMQELFELVLLISSWSGLTLVDWTHRGIRNMHERGGISPIKSTFSFCEIYHLIPIRYHGLQHHTRLLYSGCKINLCCDDSIIWVVYILKDR